MSHDEFAQKLATNTKTVDRIFRNPGLLTIDRMIGWARCLGLKLSLVAYGDEDPENILGPIPDGVFRLEWRRGGYKRDFNKDSKRKNA